MSKAMTNAFSKYSATAILASTLVFQSCLPANSDVKGGTQTPAKTDNEDQKVDTDNKTTGLSEINASLHLVTQNSRKVSLADIASRSNAELTVFNFMGVTCTSCMTEGPHVTSTINKHNGRVSQIVIYPNLIGEYQTNEYQNFVSRYAGSAPYVFDESQSVIKSVRRELGQYFGVLILVSKSGQGKIMNEEKAYLNLDAALNKALTK